MKKGTYVPQQITVIAIFVTLAVTSKDVYNVMHSLNIGRRSMIFRVISTII